MNAQVHDRIDSIPAGAWNELFPALPDSLELIQLIQQTGMDGFAFKSIVVGDDAGPLLLLPIFQANIALADLTDGAVRKAMRAFRLRLNILGIGFVEGECGAIGISPRANAQSWDLAIQRFDDLSKQTKCGLKLALNFPEVPAPQFDSFTKIATYPSARLHLPFASADEYLASLSHATRKDIRRKLRASESIEIAACTDPDDATIDRIFQLYQQTVADSEMKFGRHRRDFFARVCAQVPGAMYVLYKLDGRIVAFNLLVHHGDALVDKYFCMERDVGRAHGIYFVSWMHNVRLCIERGISIYHAGPGAEATKKRLGAQLTRSIALFRHRNPLVHRVLSSLRGMLAYDGN